MKKRRAEKPSPGGRWREAPDEGLPPRRRRIVGFAYGTSEKRNAGENAEVPPVADTARRFQGSGAIFGAVSTGNRNAATWASVAVDGVPYRVR